RANDGAIDEKFYQGWTPLVALYAASFFLALKRLDLDTWDRQWPRCSRAITALSLESYNIYLIHVVFLWMFQRGTLGFVLHDHTGGYAYIDMVLIPATALAAT